MASEHMTDDARYKAICIRDKRYDGIFYTAVKTTGIYCLPSCPAPKPMRKNVIFFDTAADALKAGFRACKRCHPDDLHWTPQQRALEKINAGDLNDSSVAQLARSLDMSERHLRRVVTQAVGASPTQLDRALKLKDAKRLLAQTKLRITDIAFSAGFQSVRQFNDVFKQTFQITPRAYRMQYAHKHVASPDTPLEIDIKLPFKRPFLWAPLKRAILLHNVAEHEHYDEQSQTLQRLIKTTHGYSKITLHLAEPKNTIDMNLEVPNIADVDQIVSIVKRVLDLDSNPQIVIDTFRDDPLIGPLVARQPGLRISGMFEPFELLINTIIGQQVSMAAARTFSTRLIREYGTKVDGLYVYPSAEVLLAADPYEMYKRTKLNHKKVATIQAVCQVLADGLDLSSVTERESTKKALLAVKGIGPWTVEYLALRGYGDPDAFPGDDLIIKRIMGAKTAKQAEVMAEKWRPLRGYATMHMWMKEGAIHE